MTVVAHARSTRVRLLICLLLASSACAAAQKQAPQANYPTKPVRLIVPFAPGGGTDLIARLVAQDLGQGWGQTVVVDNRGGSGGVIGTELAARATPDGYTMLLCSLGFSYVPALYRNLAFDAEKDFAPVSLVATQPFVYVVTPSLGVSSIKELVALAKSKPGELRYGSGGAGGSSHLGTELLRTMTGIELVHVPYKGTGPALTAMLSGEIHFQLIGIASVVPHMKAGRMRALAVSGAKRSAAAPEVPTVAESGVPGYAFDVWYGMLFPAATPRAIVEKTSADLNRVLKSPELARRFAAIGLEPGGTTPQEFATIIRKEIARWRKVVQSAGIKLQ
ncbi:MAG TPA: tripartite tricarboxylate transporter substrate binding protein [Burkholderiales bacterium]|nr:tripartite tricarboxylate transporter substrate binding protein [Burkholderiales bacterium]